VTDEPFIIELAGRRWSLPHLPFRIIKSIQPALFQVYSETLQMGASPLTESQIDNLAGAAWRAIAYVDPALGLDDFLSLPFSVADLFLILPVVAQAAGLRVQPATKEASPEMGKLTSTP
jgi:hypothetical protein